jgi:AraC-like DNA-binding protein
VQQRLELGLDPDPRAVHVRQGRDDVDPAEQAASDDVPRWTARLAAMHDEQERRADGHADALAAYLTITLVELARLAAPYTAGLRQQGQSLLADVFEVIDDRYADRLSTADVAGAVGLTPGYLTTLVRQRTGRTVLDWITERRMAAARALLLSTDLSAQAIAGRVGYDDPTYFSRRFRTITVSHPVAGAPPRCTPRPPAEPRPTPARRRRAQPRGSSNNTAEGCLVRGVARAQAESHRPREKDMTGHDHRPTALLDRAPRTGPRVADEPALAPAQRPGGPRRQPPPADGPARVDADRPPTMSARDSRPVPRGWGSHEERRLMLWGVLGFLLLGLYASVFVVLGQVVWS